MKNFEERLKRLEEIASKMKSGDIPLEEAIKMFEEGIEISKRLEKELSRIERKIQILVNNPDEAEKPKLELFPELSDEKSENT